MDKRCQNCIHFKDSGTGQDKGDCRMNAPVVYEKTNWGQRQYPEVKYDDMCGQFVKDDVRAIRRWLKHLPTSRAMLPVYKFNEDGTMADTGDRETSVVDYHAMMAEFEKEYGWKD